MPPIVAQSRRRRSMVILALSVPLLIGGPAMSAHAQDTSETVHILAPPPSRWDNQMLSGRPALSQTVSDFAAITGGITFGLGPAAVNSKLPTPAAGVAWASLPPATEFQDDVRYFWVRLDGAGDLRAGSTACVGAGSYVVFLFQERGLFRISYRLTPDNNCPRITDTAEEIFGRYVTITADIALSVHYRAGPLEVVDITDPTAGYLVATRWQPRVE